LELQKLLWTLLWMHVPLFTNMVALMILLRMQMRTCNCLVIFLKKLISPREKPILAKRPFRSDSTLLIKQFLTRQLSSILLRHSRYQAQKMKLVKSELLAKITSTVMQQILRIFTNTTSLFSTSMVTVLPIKRKKSCSKRTQNSGPKQVSTMVP